MDKPTTIRHPYYNLMKDKWDKYRLTFEGGDKFRETYLVKFSSRESDTDFAERKKVTHVPSFAKAAVLEIKNAIYNRLCEVQRIGGSKSYQEAVNGNIDLKKSTMNAFMGGVVLPELLAIGRIGVFVDIQPNRTMTGTMQDDVGRSPYVYIYTAEQILSWSYDENRELISVLVEAAETEEDEDTELTSDLIREYRLFKKHASGVEVIKFNNDGVETDRRVFPWRHIPLFILDVKESLLTDVCEYQIGLMNLSSSDMIHGIKANFPFYIEQRDPRQQNALRAMKFSAGDETDGTASKANTAANEEIQVGNVKGRTYGAGMNAPAFIHPSPEPMDISLKKQDTMKREIRQLVQLAVTNMDPRRETAESKDLDNRGLEAGLSYIAQELEKAERAIAEFWAMYVDDDVAEVKYPEDYSLISDAERLEMAQKLTENAKTSPSLTYQKEVLKQIAKTIIGHKVSNEIMSMISKEIDASSVPIVDPVVLQKDVELQICSADTAAKIRGYGPGEAKKAQDERAIRAAQIVAAQTEAADAKEEKEVSQDPAANADPGKKVRGEAND